MRTEDERKTKRSSDLGPQSSRELHPAAPYLVVLGLAIVMGLFLAAYIWSYRAEIIRILTQSPT